MGCGSGIAMELIAWFMGECLMWYFLTACWIRISNERFL